MGNRCQNIKLKVEIPGLLVWIAKWKIITQAGYSAKNLPLWITILIILLSFILFERLKKTERRERQIEICVLMLFLKPCDSSKQATLKPGAQSWMEVSQFNGRAPSPWVSCHLPLPNIFFNKKLHLKERNWTQISSHWIQASLASISWSFCTTA